MSPMIETMASQKARSLAAYIISDSIYNEVESEGLDYSELINLEKDNSGKVSALKTDIVKINKLKSALSVKILERLSDEQETEISIPLGTVVNSSFLSGRGPKLKIKLIPVGSVSTNVENVFSSAGINQTRHRIMISIKVAISVVMPFHSVAENVEGSVCIAETVIVGNVPQSFTNVENDGSYESTKDDIINFTK